MPLKPNDVVRLNTPENPRLHNQDATVYQVTPYGAIVKTLAAASGQFRALHSEMAQQHIGLNGHSKEVGYSGDICDNCQGSRMRRNGACLICDDCGMTTGCS